MEAPVLNRHMTAGEEEWEMGVENPTERESYEKRYEFRARERCGKWERLAEGLIEAC